MRPVDEMNLGISHTPEPAQRFLDLGNAGRTVQLITTQ